MREKKTLGIYIRGGLIDFEMRKMSKCKKGGCEYLFRMRGRNEK